MSRKKCKNCNCIGKIYPNNHDINISMHLNNMFNVTINNYNIHNDGEEDIEIEVLEVTDDNILNNLLTDTLNCTNGKAYDIANILHYLYKDVFRYDSNNKEWYYFNKLWKRCNNKLRTKISNEIVEYYKQTKQKLKEKSKKDKI